MEKVIKEFVPYEQALELKDLGFNKSCFGEYRQWDGNPIYLQLYQDLDGCSTDPADYEYTTECHAPTYSQAFRWFREKHKLEGEVRCIRFNSDRLKGYQYVIISENYQKFEQLGNYYTPEEAELACLKKLIEIVKTK
jgi:hypothetical protein